MHHQILEVGAGPGLGNRHHLAFEQHHKAQLRIVFGVMLQAVLPLLQRRDTALALSVALNQQVMDGLQQRFVERHQSYSPGPLYRLRRLVQVFAQQQAILAH